ncbi:MAG: hypothetical protein Q8M29_11015 [Bacteroidota bacterium]|nr:hypothetical protein [Bacteroidota bacterium]
MNPKSALFNLIQSLSSNERGYFVKYGFKNSGSRDKNQLIVFNWLCKQKEYDEKKIQQFFFPNSPNDWRIIKHHLFNRIVSCLVDYGKENTIENFVSNELAKAKVLIGRALYLSAKRTAERAVKEALLAERYDLAYTALSVVKDSDSHVLLNQEVFDLYKKLEQQQLDCLRKTENILQYRSLMERYKLIESKVSNVDYLSSESLKEANELNQSELLQNNEQALSFEAKCIYHVCKAYYYNAQKDSVKRRRNSRELLHHLESRPEKMKYYAVKYRTAINQYLNACFSTKTFDDFDEYLQKLEDSRGNLNNNLSARNFLIIENLRMNKNFSIEHPEKNLQIIKEFEKQLLFHENHLPIESFHALYVNAAISLVYAGSYKQGLIYINKILNNFNESRNKAVITIAKSLNLLVHFELKNEELIKYLIRSYASEDVKILNFLSRVVENKWNRKNTKRKNNAPDLLTEEWEGLKQDKSSLRIIQDAYLDVWLKKRIGLA